MHSSNVYMLIVLVSRKRTFNLFIAYKVTFAIAIAS